MSRRGKRKRLLDAYRFPGFRPHEMVKGVFGDHTARVITLLRRSKKPSVAFAVGSTAAGTIAESVECATCRAPTLGSTSRSTSAAWLAGAVAA